MYKKVVKLALFVQFIVLSTYAQPQRGNYDPANMPRESKITGKVIDKTSALPVEYAAVGIFSMRDSSLISGGVSDASGVFSIDKLPYGRFYVEIKFLGYNKLKINGVMLNPNQKVANMGEVKLEPATTALQEVEVVGTKNTPVEYKIDKKIVSVSDNVIAAGGTAVDALENTPSVQVDIEGNVALRGSSNFTVLIDGRPSVLKGSEALQQIPASAIHNIEIITNPSAKYDPEGSAGIINVIMKKQKQAGMNGVINSSISSNGGYSGDFLINLRSSKINYYIGADIRQMRFKNEMHSSKETYGDSASLFEEVDENFMFKRYGYGIKGGFDYFINPKNTLSLSGSYHSRNGGREASSYNHYYQNNLAFENNYFKKFNDFKREHESKEGNIDYTHYFNENGHQLQASVNYSEGPGTEKTWLRQYSTDPNWFQDPATLPTGHRTYEGGNENELTTKIDYSYPISEKTTLEAGYQGDYEHSKDEYRLEMLSAQSSEPFEQWNEDPTKYKNMTFKDDVQAFYSTFSSSVNWVDYQVGLRLENSNRELDQKVINQKVVFNKWDLFPSIHLSKKFKNDFQLQTSYSRRIRRPGERELDPCEIISDSRNIRKGNPELTPEYTDSYELNLQKSFANGAAFISGEFFHRHTSNLISNYEYKRDDTVSVMTFMNLNDDYSTGFEGMVNMPLAKWWNLNSSISLYDYRLRGSLTENAEVDKNSFNWNARINSMFRFKTGTSLQIMGFYDAPSITAQGRREGFFFTNVGVRQDFFKRKLTLSLQVRDLFGNSKFERTQEGSNFKSFYSMKRQAQVVTFSLSFKINNYKPEKKDRENGGNEMEFNNEGGGMM